MIKSPWTFIKSQKKCIVETHLLPRSLSLFFFSSSSFVMHTFLGLALVSVIFLVTAQLEEPTHIVKFKSFIDKAAGNKKMKRMMID